MAKLKEKFERATAVTLTMPGGKTKLLMETERHACIRALSGHLQNWEQRCSVLYQVIGALADHFGVFETSDDVADALDVAAGRGDVEKLLPWPKDMTFGKAPDAPTEEMKRVASEMLAFADRVDRFGVADHLRKVLRFPLTEDARKRVLDTLESLEGS